MRTAITVLTALIVGLGIYLVVVDWWPTGHGSVVVTSDPPGAQIWVDLRPTDLITDGKIVGLSDGEHSVTVRMDTLLADPFARVVLIHGGKPDTIHFTLRTPHGELVARSNGEGLSSAAETMPIATQPAEASIPTAAEVRASPSHDSVAPSTQPGSSAADLMASRSPGVDTSSISLAPPIKPADVSTPVRSPEVGVIQISSSQPGATIFISDREIPERTPANITMPFGSYAIRVELAGYSVSPDEQSVRVSRAVESQSVHFTLQKATPEMRGFTVETTPVEGRIFVDGTLVGEGSANCTREYGSYTVSFGDVDGWRKPDPVRVTVMPKHADEDVKANYIRLYHAYAQANGEDSVAAEGIEHWSVGIIFEKNKPQPSTAFGPKIKGIPNSKKYGWELGMGDPNQNPTGGDYVLFSFTLPPDVPTDTPLNLRLYLYRSMQRYPFSLAARSEIVVEVNSHVFLDGFTPQFETYGADANRYEEWSLHRALKPGENQILVYAGDSNTVFNYLWKVEVE